MFPQANRESFQQKVGIRKAHSNLLFDLAYQALPKSDQSGRVGQHIEIPMVEVGLISGWIALVVIVRDFAVSGLRSFAAAEGVVISARQWGKQKLVITVVAIVWRLLAAAYLAATGRQHELATLTIGIAVADYARGPATMAFLDRRTAGKAIERATARGYFDAAESALEGYTATFVSSEGESVEMPADVPAPTVPEPAADPSETDDEHSG
jgi:hypothetical protein